MLALAFPIKLSYKQLKTLPPAGVNVPNPVKPVDAADAGAPNDELNPPGAAFCPNKPPE